jgi:hypothetical protein
MISRPDVIYCSIIDVETGPHTREYPISRQVPPGDAEHFQIVIGARKSSHLRLKIQFFIDKNQIIESKTFPIEIWNPRDSRYRHQYVDGSEIRPNANVRQKRPEMDDKYRLFEELMGRYDSQENDFPFYTPPKRGYEDY